MIDLEIATGFAPGERAAVGTLYWTAFSRKLGPAFGDPDVGRALVTASLRPDRVLVARAGGQVLGVCGFHLGGHGAVDVTWRLLRSRLGRPAAARAALVLAPLDRDGRPDVLVLDGICVTPEQRGRGIGAALLDAASRQAADAGLRGVQLTVVDTNPRAAALYHRAGFRIIDESRIGALGALYGFDRYRTMHRPVAEQVTR